jgi:hypothetical protein
MKGKSHDSHYYVAVLQLWKTVIRVPVSAQKITIIGGKSIHITSLGRVQLCKPKVMPYPWTTSHKAGRKIKVKLKYTHLPKLSFK